jgi:hypothetical protein
MLASGLGSMCLNYQEGLWSIYKAMLTAELGIYLLKLRLKKLKQYVLYQLRFCEALMEILALVGVYRYFFDSHSHI